MLSHIYYLYDSDLLQSHPHLRNGTLNEAMMQREVSRYTRLSDASCRANVITLGQRAAPRECRKRNGSMWTPPQFAKLLREHIKTSLLPGLNRGKRKRRAVVLDDSPEVRRRGGPFVDDEASDGGEAGEEEDDDNDADEHGNLAGFVVSDHSSSSASTPGSDSAASAEVEITGTRSRRERDAEGMANAIDLVTPTRA